MAILIDQSKRVMVQGITGREGISRTRLMKNYGTQVVAGVTPGKGGQVVEGVPVFDSVKAAWDSIGKIDISVLFIPAPLVREAAIEAIEAGVKLLVIVPDRVPIYDVLEILAVAQAHHAHVIGPNTLGILSPNQGVLGMIGGRAASASEWFFPGPVGISSRSGGITTSIAYYLAQAGIGASTLVHVGGDAIVGMPHPEVIKHFEHDPQTRAIVMFGEIGTSQEEQVAELIATRQVTKPVIAYIGGKAARQGTRFSHAGAIIEGNRGTYAGKVSALRAAGAIIVGAFADIPQVTQEVLQSIPAPPATPSTELHWTTNITEIRPNQIRVRGYPIEDLIGGVPFSHAVYLVLTGNLPTQAEGQLLDAVLVSSIDHGASPPSTLAARTATSTGAPLNAALAAGVLSINRHHGGAIESCMLVLSDVLERAKGQSVDAVAKAYVKDYKAKKQRIAGFGHRIHTSDPRATRLLVLAQTLSFSGKPTAALLALQQQLSLQNGRDFPINVDGAIAAILLELSFTPTLANSLFIIARLPGLVAHIYEEMSTQRPMRRIHPSDHDYGGNPPRCP